MEQSTSEQKPTPEQLAACQLCKLDPHSSTWKGSVMIVPYWGAANTFALISHSGSVTYAHENMLDVHLAGISE